MSKKLLAIVLSLALLVSACAIGMMPVSAAATTITAGNQAMPFTGGFSGWVIIPIENIVEQWDHYDATSFDELTAWNSLSIMNGNNYGYNVYIDQIAVVDDIDAFASTVETTLPVDGQDYRVLCDFDDIDYTINDSDLCSVVGGVSPYGKAVQWARGTSGGPSKLSVGFAPVDWTQYPDAKAVAFWYSYDFTTGTTHNMTFGFGLSNENTGMWRVNNGSTCYKVAVDKDAVTPDFVPSADLTAVSNSAASRGGIVLNEDYNGWVIIPLDQMARWWGTDTNPSLKDFASATTFSLQLGLATNYNASVVIDQVGFVWDINRFAAKVKAGTLTESDYTVANGFDPETNKALTTVSYNGNGALVEGVSPYGTALQINRSTNKESKSSQVTFSLGMTGNEIKNYAALVFWYGDIYHPTQTSCPLSSLWVTTGSTSPYAMEKTATYYTVSTEDMAASDTAISYMGASVKEGENALRFGWEVNASNVTVGDDHFSRADDLSTTDATVMVNGEAYTLVDFGAYLTNVTDGGIAGYTMQGSDKVKKVQGIRVLSHEDGAVQFVVRVMNIPTANAATAIWACPYFTYSNGTDTITVYGEVVSASLNSVIAG
ncbi:MAG: hypothetical protein IJ518_07415 [Clostridia bacterium]|nr:hypothetical protein [Clostridia bacterium]